MEETKKRRGGARVGSGRKLQGVERKLTLCVMIPPTTKEKLVKEAKVRGISVGQLVEFLVERM